ncbi:MAG: hypothetical protein ACSHXH_04380 [Marivita sp.]|uniref:hypothetical protein n=1 Tax=Marivita sp. TaxID=2003365 RepID=UPI003EF6B730
MGYVKRRLLLSLAALSPGVVTITLQEFAVSLAFMALGLFGAIGLAVVAVSISPQVKQAQFRTDAPSPSYPSLVLTSAFADLRQKAPDPLVIRATLYAVMTPTIQPPGFVTEDEKVAMVLAQIMARWGETDPMSVSDDQSCELWLVERLMRATPAEAGALAVYFAAPNAMLTMRDRIAPPVTA